ncbi:hypothetical protein ACFC00_40125 [Streptomyces adustus]|uniref:hypothetical protein n=1 Tax=Streptomyces adustus TaxID=1609272 RepID=UPI0035E067D0
MDPIEIPESFAALDDHQLADLLNAATAEFQALRGQDTVGADDMNRMRALAAGARSIREEQAARLTTAEEAAAEIDTLAADLELPSAPEGEPGGAEPEEPTAAADPADGEPTDGEPDRQRDGVERAAVLRAVDRQSAQRAAVRDRAAADPGAARRLRRYRAAGNRRPVDLPV